MPAILLERLPFPSLRSYISLSILALGLAAFYAHQTVRTKLNFDLLASEPLAQLEEEFGMGLPPELANVTLPYGNDEHFLNMLYVMRVETWCIWTLVNSCYCLLILLGKLIQNIVFGELRVSEKQHLKDKFWNFVFYKFIFIFGVMNVQSMDEVVQWVAWFSALGFLHLLTQLAKDRFEYLSFSPATPRSAHVKLLSLLVVILVTCVLLLMGCTWVGINISLTIFAFLGAESLLLLLKCLYVVARYVIQLWDMNQEGVWEARAVYVYYTELSFELLALVVDFSHHMHMLLYGNIFLSMASLVICMQLKYLFYEFQRRIKKHKNYLKVVKDMEAKFPMATQEDLEQNADDCAICWEKMESARKLPCGHLFHNSCLRSWLEQDTSCPTCRTALSDAGERPPHAMHGQPGVPNLADAIVPQGNQGTTNHFFHFDGSRYVSWLPSFSVEVTHTNLLPGQQAHATQTSQLDNMAREVQVVFPSIPQSVIMEDLRLTRSVDLTIDNILEGRVVIPPQVPALGNGGTQRTENQNGNSNSAEAPFPSLVSSEMREEHHPEPQHLQLTPHGAVGGSFNNSAQPHEEASASSSTPVGGRFSKSASERMTMLQQRKQAMLEQARRKYQNKEKMSSQSVSSVTEEHIPSTNGASPRQTDTSEEAVRRRALLLEATQRRLDMASNSQ